MAHPPCKYAIFRGLCPFNYAHLYSSAAATTARDGIAAVADQKLDITHRNAKRIGGDNRDDGAAASAQVLGGHLDFDRAVRMNGEIAITVVTAAAPGVQGEAQPTLQRARRLVAPRMPVSLPLHQLSRDRELVAVSISALARELQIAGDEVVRIHLHLRGEIFDRAHGDDGRLRMIWGAPCASASLVSGDGDALFTLIWDLEDIRQRRRTTAPHSTGPPGS